jgi:hypothetical protein
MEVAVMDVVERITSWERVMPWRIMVIVAVTVKRGEKAMEEDEEEEEACGKLLLD